MPASPPGATSSGLNSGYGPHVHSSRSTSKCLEKQGLHDYFAGLSALGKSPDEQNQNNETDRSEWTVLQTVSASYRVSKSEAVLTCFKSSSQFILTAALRYFRLSSLNLPDISPICSKLSPRYKRSSIFFVMTWVTSRSSSFSLSRFEDARLS